MASRRQDAATALTGAALLGAGGGLRHAGVSQAVGNGQFPRIHLSALKGAKRGPKGLYLAGTGLGLVGTAALSQGAFGLARHRKVAKADKKPLWQEGIAGTGEALRGRADSIKTPTPTKVRASQWAIAGGAGAGGSAVARALLRHRTGKAKALLAPIAGGLAATASIPVSNRVVRRQTKGQYVVTPTGVRRAKDVIKKPSSKAHMVSSRNGPMRGQVVPSDSRFGKSTSYRQQRAAITAAGATPVVGPYAQAHLAGSYAPKGERGKNAARQFAMGPAAGNVAGVGGAYGAAHLARHSAKVGAKAESAMAWKTKQTDQLRGHVGLKPAKPAAEGTVRHAVRAAAERHPMAKPLVHSRATMAAAGLGFLATRAAVGTVGTQRAITLNQRDQSRARVGKGIRWKTGVSSILRTPYHEQMAETARIDEAYAGRYDRSMRAHDKPPRWKPSSPGRDIQGENKKALTAANERLSRSTAELAAFRAKNAHILNKRLLESGQTKKDKHTLARTKRTNAALAVTSGTLGLTSLGLLAARQKPLATSVGILASGVGGTNSLIGARVQRREARNIDPVKKAGGLPKALLRGIGSEGIARARVRTATSDPVAQSMLGRRKEFHDVVRQLKAEHKAGSAWVSRTSRGTKPDLARVRNTSSLSRQQFGKGYLPELEYNGPRQVYHQTLGRLTIQAYHGNGRFTVQSKSGTRLMHRDHIWPKKVQKDIGADHRDLIRRYGDRGPLPKNLHRDEKIRAYEARYAAHGGKKGEKWQHRANVAEGVRNAALGSGTVALAGLAHLKTKRGGRLALKHPHLQNRLDHMALASGAAGGAAELSGEVARDRRASYASSPGGVAASALTRMKANTPGAT